MAETTLRAEEGDIFEGKPWDNKCESMQMVPKQALEHIKRSSHTMP